jgi:hypothetical protein
MARRDEREYREYLSEEQRRQPGCPARELCRESRGRDTSQTEASTGSRGLPSSKPGAMTLNPTEF